MLVSSELSTWHLKCFNRHFRNERKKQKYINDFEEFLEELAYKVGQEPRFEVDDAENCDHDDKQPPAVRVRLRISTKFRAEKPENTFTEAVSSFCSQILSNLANRDMKQTIARITNYGLAGIVPISRTFRVFYARVWFQALFEKNIPSLTETLGPVTDFWPPFFKGVLVGLVVIYNVYGDHTSSESAESNDSFAHLTRMALDIWGRLTRFCTFKAEEPPQKAKSETHRLSKELAEELKTFDRVVSIFKQTDDSTLCVDPDLSTDMMDSTLRMFDITADLITVSSEMLNHFRKVSETFYHNRNACLGFAAAGGGTAFGIWYSGKAAANSSAVIIPGVACGVAIGAAGYNWWQASNAEKERKSLQNVTDNFQGIYVRCQKIATTLLPVTEIELRDEDEEMTWKELEPQNDGGNTGQNTSIKSMREFYVNIPRKKKVVSKETHYEKFYTVFLEEDEQIKKYEDKIAEIDSTFAKPRK